VDSHACVTGDASINGVHTDASAAPGIGGSAATAPTEAGTSCGKATPTSCNGATHLAMSGGYVTTGRNPSFSADLSVWWPSADPARAARSARIVESVSIPLRDGSTT